MRRGFLGTIVERKSPNNVMVISPVTGEKPVEAIITRDSANTYQVKSQRLTGGKRWSVKIDGNDLVII